MFPSSFNGPEQVVLDGLATRNMLSLGMLSLGMLSLDMLIDMLHEIFGRVDKHVIASIPFAVNKIFKRVLDATDFGLAIWVVGEASRVTYSSAKG